MIKIKKLLGIFMVVFFAACSDDDYSTKFLDDVAAPSNISALFTITQNNSGLVTIRPNGTNITSYKIYFGDDTAEPAVIGAGQTTNHIYAEGNYDVRIVGVGINGLETELVKPLTVTFRAPENLEVNITPRIGNPYIIDVTASADYETFFEITFGDDPDATPIQFNEGDEITHTYEATGEYLVTVTALSGGAATTVYTEEISIFDPLVLPINFESSTLNYTFESFGGANSTVVDNPDISDENTSSKVGRLTKNAGSEVWAGSLLTLDEPIDFTQVARISVKTWSPTVGAIVKLKVENATDANVFVEVDQVTTVAGGWETLIFNFNGINSANNYQKVVIFFDFGNNGTGADYYFDDIMLEQLILPLTFESSGLTYDFGNFGGANTTVQDNPSPTSINTSSKVARFTKDQGSEVWAGSAIALDQPIDFSSVQKIKMKVWSPAAGSPVLLKLENLNNADINMEIQVPTTVANGWEELTFDFSGINNANQYQQLVFFFNFGTSGTGESYYFDDIKLSN